MQPNQQAETKQQPSSTIIRDLFPLEGKARAKQSALFLGVGLSTFWLYVKQGRIQQPMKYGARVSVWDASYIRELANNGIPEAPKTES